LRATGDLIALQTKEPEGIRVEKSDLASNVVKKDILPMIVGIQGLTASTVRSWGILLEIAVLQERD
ncbi:hypothetical protein A2U01_0079094, partial [Trifolium medium]|nr:hypothetical protein [Trifolium medium]